MPSSFTPSLRIELQANGENDTTWGDIVNQNFKNIDAAIAGRVDITLANADHTLTKQYGADDESRGMLIVIGGSATAPRNLIVPDVSKQYIVRNITSGNQSITVKTASGAGVTLSNGETRLLVCDGSNVFATGAGSDAKISASGVDTVAQSWVFKGFVGVNHNSAVDGGYGVFGADGTVGSYNAWYANGALIGTMTAISSLLALNAPTTPIVFATGGVQRQKINTNGTIEFSNDVSSTGSFSGMHGVFQGDVYGRSATITNGAPTLYFNDTDTTADRSITFNNGLLGFVLSNGNWAAYTDDSGNFVAAGNVTAFSDERKKKDWEDVEPDFIERLAGVLSGTYTDIDSGERRAGVGAQSMQKVLPEAVKETHNGFLGVAYGNAALVACVELAREVLQLRERLATLEAGSK